ncbi:MAG TPA: zinc-ribbon domain-containing protein, partial [Polyangiaceae bacterium]
MKFLCPSCKAKYQIADEKVAGRSVRMKCRKCGYVIQVSSVAGLGDALPGSEPPSPMDMLSDATAAPAPAAPEPARAELPEPPVAPAARPAAPSTAGTSRLGKPGAIPGPSILRPAAGSVAAAKAPLPAPKAPPTKSSPMKPAVVPAPAPAPAAFGLKSDKRTIQGGAGAPPPAVAPKPAAGKPASPLANALGDIGDDDESTRIADAGALAGAFSLAVGGASTDAPHSEVAMPADEWFVGINGVPVGPI